MHDTPDQVHWYEPEAGDAGYGTFLRKPMSATFVHWRACRPIAASACGRFAAFPNRSVERAWQAQLEHPPPERSWHVPPGVSDPDLAVGIVGLGRDGPSRLACRFRQAYRRRDGQMGQGAEVRGDQGGGLLRPIADAPTPPGTPPWPRQGYRSTYPFGPSGRSCLPDDSGQCQRLTHAPHKRTYAPPHSCLESVSARLNWSLLASHTPRGKKAGFQKWGRR